MASFSRTLLLIGFLFMVVLLVASEVSARDLAETSTQTGSISTNHYYKGYHKGGYKCKYGKCCKGPHCHEAAEETQATATVANTETSGEGENTNAAHLDGHGHYGGGHGHYGGGGHGHYGGGGKKCKYGKCCKGPHC